MTITNKNMMDGKIANIGPATVSQQIIDEGLQTAGGRYFDGTMLNEKYMWLHNSDLEADPSTRRDLIPSRLEKIQNDFSPYIANPLKVSYRDGKYFVIDGNFTREAEISQHAGSDFMILCRVFFGLTLEDEAMLAAAHNGFSEDIPMRFRLRNLAVAKDKNVLDFMDITSHVGFSISLGRSLSLNGSVAAVCTAFKAYCSLGARKYERMLKMVHRTWAGERWSVNRYMIAGMARFTQMYEVRINDFVKAFREVTYQEIKDEAGRFRGMSKDGAFAAALAELYELNTATSLQEVG